MASVKSAYGTSGQTITCTLASLASSATAGRESSVVDNTTDLFIDVLVMVKIKTSASALANDKAVYVYLFATVDDGTTWPDAVVGAGDAAITLQDPTNLRLLGSIFAPNTSTTYPGGPWSVAQAMGGVMPKKWGIVVRNYTGQNLDATEGNMSKLYQGVYATSV